MQIAFLAHTLVLLDVFHFVRIVQLISILNIFSEATEATDEAEAIRRMYTN